MAYRSGQHGKLFIQNNNLSSNSVGNADNEVGSVRNWSINFQQDVLVTTCLSDTDQTITHGLRSFTGSGTVLYFEENNSNITELTRNLIRTRTNNNATYLQADFGRNNPSTYIKLDLRLDSGDANAENIEVFAMMTSFNITCSTGEIVTADFQFTGHGAPTIFDYK